MRSAIGDNPIVRDMEVMSGTPVFEGSRVTVRTLFDYLQGGDSIDDFLEQYPGVTREQAVRVIELASAILLPDDQP